MMYNLGHFILAKAVECAGFIRVIDALIRVRLFPSNGYIFNSGT